MHELDEIVRIMAEATFDSPRTVDVDPEAPDELWDLIWGRSETIVRFERFHGASVMTDSPAAALDLFDAGPGKVFLIAPADLGIDVPMTAFARVVAGDWQGIGELVGSVYQWSRCAGQLPAAGSIHDRIHVHRDLDPDPLGRAIEATIRRGCLDPQGVGVIVRRALGEPPSEDPAGLARQYLRSVVHSFP